MLSHSVTKNYKIINNGFLQGMSKEIAYGLFYR
jgi:hypothetical protein